MLILIIGLIILAGIAMAVGVLHNRQIQKKIESGELKTAPEIVKQTLNVVDNMKFVKKKACLPLSAKK